MNCTCTKQLFGKFQDRTFIPVNRQNYDFCRNLCEIEANPWTISNCFVVSEKVNFSNFDKSGSTQFVDLGEQGPPLGT